MDEKRKPIILIDIDSQGKFIINKKALEFLQSIKENVSVLTVCGPYRSGKSYLLNRFLNKQQYFQVGPTTNACTKGIWLSQNLIQNENNNQIIVLDTEGLGSFNRDDETDSKLFLLSCLLSSTLIYNILSVFDEKTLEQISFIASLSYQLGGQNLKEIERNFPKFVCVLRDFALDLKNMSPNQYFESQLRPIESNEESQLKKNQIRMGLLQYFKERECFTLIRPLIDEKKLRDIDNVEYEDLRPQFREQLEQFIFLQLQTIKPKFIKNNLINGEVFSELIVNLVEKINSKAIPKIHSVYQRMMESEQVKIQEKVFKLLDQQIQNIQKNFPMDETDLIKQVYTFKENCDQIINTYQFDLDLQKQIKVSFQKHFQERFSNLLQQNKSSSNNFCNLISDKLIESLEEGLENQENFLLIIQQIQNLKKLYEEDAKGPGKWQVLSEIFFDQSLRVIERQFNFQQIQQEKYRSEQKNQILQYKMKSEALDLLIKQERDRWKNHLDQIEKKNEEYNQKIIQKNEDLKKLYEQRIQQIEKNTTNQGELKEIKELLSQQISNNSLQESFGANNQNPFIDQKVGNRIEIQMIQIQNALNTLNQELKVNQQKQIQQNQNLYQDKKILDLEKMQMEEIRQINEKHSKQIELMKISYEQQIEILNHQNKELVTLKEKHMQILFEREGLNKVLKEKIKTFENEKLKSGEQTELLNKVSSNLIKVLKKLENNL